MTSEGQFWEVAGRRCRKAYLVVTEVQGSLGSYLILRLHAIWKLLNTVISVLLLEKELQHPSSNFSMKNYVLGTITLYILCSIKHNKLTKKYRGLSTPIP